MKEEIKFYDRKGFVPSKKIRTIDDYLRESEKKNKILEDFETNPHKFAYEQFGIENNFELMYVSEKWRKRFYERFFTEPLYAIVTDKKSFNKISSNNDKIGHYITKILIFAASYGTILKFKKEDIKLNISIIKKDENKEEAYDTICHETIHCIREQNKRFLNRFRYGLFVEETLAYLINDKMSNHTFKDNISLRILPGIINSIYFIIPSVAFVIWNGFSGLTIPGLFVANSFYYGNKTANFFNKCEKEGINPYYLFLRSDPSEYSKRKPIIDQLYKNNNLRFKIMSNRLDIT